MSKLYQLIDERERWQHLEQDLNGGSENDSTWQWVTEQLQREQQEREHLKLTMRETILGVNNFDNNWVVVEKP